jgi:hypothetical protein
MAKRCIPNGKGGFICIENITLCVLALLIFSVGYLYYLHYQSLTKENQSLTKENRSLETGTTVINNVSSGSGGYGVSDLQNMYIPPLNTIDVRGPIELPPIPLGGLGVNSPVPLVQTINTAVPLMPLSTVVQNTVPLGVGIPVNIRTTTANTPFRQIGILTKDSKSTEPLILPLFGRSLLNGRDKWQYYTVVNSGGAAFNAKLPIKVKGRSCTGEYGCDSVYTGDTVYVEGYQDTFRATIYENATMNYIPF